jgi:hypothetical protein
LSTGPATNFKVGSLNLNKKVLQAELWRALAKDSFTQLLELKAFSVGPNFQSSQIFSKSVRKYLHLSLEIYIIDINLIGQQISLILKVGQNYHNFNLQRNYKDFKLQVTEKLLIVKLKIKNKSNDHLENFKDIFRKIIQLRYLEKCYGLSLCW